MNIFIYFQRAGTIHTGSPCPICRDDYLVIDYRVGVLTSRNHIYQVISLGPVVQSIISIMRSLRGQLVKCFMTLKPNTLIFFVEKLRETFALQKLHTIFQQKILAYFKY